MASKATRLLLAGCKDSLTNESSKERYLNKIKLINSLDPYELMTEDWKDDVDLCKHVFTSPYTQEDLENYKSLECYQTFIAGWVRDVLAKDVGDKIILTAKVSHLQLKL